MTLEHSLHRRQTHYHSFHTKTVMQDFSTLISFCTERQDAGYNLSRKFAWMMQWPRGACGDNELVRVSRRFDPTDNRPLIVFGVPGDLSCTPSIANHPLGCF